MALLQMSWDLPSNDRLPIYNERTRTDWIPRLLHQPGVREFRGYRNPRRISPQVLIHIEYTDLDSLHNWLASPEYAAMMSEMREVGCKQFKSEVWERSPVMPEPLRPSAEKMPA